MSRRYLLVRRMRFGCPCVVLMRAAEQEGVRRTICDMALIIFHLVFSAFTFEGVDMSMAEKILNYNIKRYPNGS